MSKISYIISKGNFEIIRDKIPQILATELYNQYLLLTDKINNDPPTDPTELADLQLSLDSLPIFDVSGTPTIKVYLERTSRPGTVETPFLNVILQNNPVNQLYGNETYRSNTVYVVEAYQSAKETESERGDTRSAKKLHRLINMCWKILGHGEYKYLDNEEIVNSRKVNDIKIGLPELGATTSESEIYGRFDLVVDMNEENEQNPEIELQGNDTTVNYDNENSYYWVNDLE